MSSEELGSPPPPESPEDARRKVAREALGTASRMLNNLDNVKKMEDAVRKFRKLANDLEKTL